MKKIRVAVFDDNLFFRESVNILFEGKGREDLELIGSFKNGNNVLKDIHISQPDVVLMDIDMPGTNGIEAVRIIRKEFPQLPVMMLTDYDDDDKVINSICAGANGYTLKTTTAQKIIDGIRDVYNGEASLCAPVARKVLQLFSGRFPESNNSETFKLSPREKEVLNELVKGHAYKIIAENLGITYDTVRAHIKQIYKKLQVSTVSGAVAKAMKRNIVSA